MGLLRTVVVIGAVAIVIAIIRGQQKERLPLIIGGKVEPGFEEVLQVFRYSIVYIGPTKSLEYFGNHIFQKFIGNEDVYCIVYHYSYHCKACS